MCEKMVANLVARRRSGKTIGGEDIGKFREKVGEEISLERRRKRRNRGKA